MTNAFVAFNSAQSLLKWHPGFKPAPDAPFSSRDYELANVLNQLGTRSEQRPQPPQRPTTVVSPGSDPLGARLFDARGQAKAIAASLSMHLTADWRTKVHRQIDELLEATEWDNDTGILDPRTMRTFLRFVIFADIKAVPSLGLSPAGNMVAAWRRDTRRLTIEFLPDDMCRLAISHFTGDDPSIFTFAGKVTSARSYLQRESFSLE
jgi:hypothetical protein